VPTFELLVVKDRVVIAPPDAVWRTEVIVPDAGPQPRFKATTTYLAAVAAQVLELSELHIEGIFGDPRAPLRMERVTLSPRAPVVQHLVELLGSNDDLAFAVVTSWDGKLRFSYSLARR
jgi:hypothetical protein